MPSSYCWGTGSSSSRAASTSLNCPMYLLPSTEAEQRRHQGKVLVWVARRDTVLVVVTMVVKMGIAAVGVVVRKRMALQRQM